MHESPETKPQQYWLQPSMHPTYARLLCAYLRRSGLDWPEILSGTQINLDHLQFDYDKYLSLAQMTRIVKRATLLMGRSWLGYEVGRIATISAHGAVGHTAISAPNVRASLDVIMRFARLRFRLIGITLEMDTENCVIRIEELADWGLVLREFVLLIVFSTITQLLDSTAAYSYQVLSIDWPLSKPSAPVDPERLLHAPIVYDAQRFGMRISASALDLPCMMADPGIYKKGLRDCEAQLHHQLNNDVSTACVYNLLLQKAPAYPKLDEIAHQLAVSRRTLMRRLEAEGSSFQALLDKARQELTTWYLLETDLPVTHIANLVGYEDPSNFARTFRRWHGTTPLEMRRTR